MPMLRDPAEFERLYRATSGKTYALMLRMSGNRQAAEDLTQEAYLRAWRAIDTFRGDSSFATWLRPIAVRTAIDHARAAERRPQLVEADVELGAKPRSHETAIDLERAIAHLPTGARHILVLHDIAGYKHEEIAELLGIAVGTTKSQLHRARQLIIQETRNGQPD